jgi:hypothetical protein
MNQWCHFQISYFVKNQNVMQQSATCNYNILYLSVNELMDQTHKKLVQHKVLMQTVFSAPPI